VELLIVEKIDINIDSGFVGITIDKNFYRDGSHKATCFFNNCRIHIKLSDNDLKRFKEFSLI
jgi:hypothetical protein